MKHQDIVEFCIPLLYLVVSVILDDKKGIYFDKILVSEYKLFKRSNKANHFIALVQ
jgi:hypothetical protein